MDEIKEEKKDANNQEIVKFHEGTLEWKSFVLADEIEIDKLILLFSPRSKFLPPYLITWKDASGAYHGLPKGENIQVSAWAYLPQMIVPVQNSQNES